MAAVAGSGSMGGGAGGAPGGGAPGGGAPGGGDDNEDRQRRQNDADLTFLKDSARVILLDRARLQAIVDAIRRLRSANAFRGVPGVFRGTDLLALIDSGVTVDVDPALRVPGKTFNLGSDSNGNYLSAAIIASSSDATVFEDGAECSRCADGAGPFLDCSVIEAYLKGACSNCGYSNNFKKCGHSEHKAQRRVKAAPEVAAPSQARRPGSALGPSAVPGPVDSHRYVKVRIPDSVDEATPEGLNRIAALTEAQGIRNRLAAAGVAGQRAPSIGQSASQATSQGHGRVNSAGSGSAFSSPLPSRAAPAPAKENSKKDKGKGRKK
jgi:hypothetical protein